MLNHYLKVFHLGPQSHEASSGVISLLKPNREFWLIFLLTGLLLLGAELPACLTVPKTPATNEVPVSFFFMGHHDSVCLSADFNGWSSESHCLQRKGDEWSIQLFLPPGSYRYGFVIDKKEWVRDPEALIQEDDGFGSKNSVLLIDPAVTKRPPAP